MPRITPQGCTGPPNRGLPKTGAAILNCLVYTLQQKGFPVSLIHPDDLTGY